MAHRGVLGLLVLLGVFIALQPSIPSPVPPALLTVTALSLGLGLIFARALTRSPALPAPARPWLAALSLLCAVGIGIAGLAATMLEGARDVGLGFTLGGLILALRPPTLEERPRRRR